MLSRKTVNARGSSLIALSLVGISPLLMGVFTYYHVYWALDQHDHRETSTYEQFHHQIAWQTKDNKDNVLVVVSSDRVDGILPVIGSILRSTDTVRTPVDVVLIGDYKINERVRKHFGDRINELISLTVDDVKDDLVAQGMDPIWMWDDWHSSINNKDWENENTIRTGEWDKRDVHAHELNHLRFYLPHMGIFQERKHLFFVDDDILVQSDLATIASKTLATLDRSKGFVTPCNIWKWSSSCHNFRFSSEEETIMETTPAYGDRNVCQSATERNCVPESYHEFVKSVIPGGSDVDKQLAWNFGFSLFALDHWRDLGLTEKYEVVMRESYRLHVFPETSLTFGLGASFLAFVGAVECWNDDKVKVRDAFGFIDFARFEETFGKGFLSTFDVLHYTGSAKPWSANATIGEKSLEPWLQILREENLKIPAQLPPDGNPKDLFTMLGSDMSESNHIMTTLDRHPQVCAPGESQKAEIGFPHDVLRPDGHSWYPVCSIKRGCTHAFVRDAIKEITQGLDANNKVPERCGKENIAKHDDPLDRHLQRICNFVEDLDGDFSPSSIARIWIEAYKTEDKRLLECGCQRGALAKGLAVDADWLVPEGFPYEQTGPPLLELNRTAVVGNKVIRMKRRDLWARVKARFIAEVTLVWDPQSAAEKQVQLEKVPEGGIVIKPEDLTWRMHKLHAIDQAADEWARARASEVLWIEYEDCKENTRECLGRIADFLKVDRTYFDKESVYGSVFSSVVLDGTLDYIANKEQVREVLDQFEKDVKNSAAQERRH